MKQILFLLAMILCLSCNNYPKWKTDNNPQTLTVQPDVSIRFNNPIFNPATKKYKVDVEVQSKDSVQVFGINVRFFYDASTFVPGNINTVKFTDFAPGYGVVIPNPPYIATAQIGYIWFGLHGSAVTYVNGAVQLLNTQATPLYINQWVKLFSVELTTPMTVIGSNPCIIWDKKLNPYLGGYMYGSDGVTITTIDHISNGQIFTVPTTEHAVQFNWVAIKDTPVFGHPTN